MKIYIDEDEIYPAYSASRKIEGALLCPLSVEVSPTEANWIFDIQKKNKKLQTFLRKKYNEKEDELEEQDQRYK